MLLNDKGKILVMLEKLKACFEENIYIYFYKNILLCTIKNECGDFNILNFVILHPWKMLTFIYLLEYDEFSTFNKYWSSVYIKK